MDWKASPAFAAASRTDALVLFRAPDEKRLAKVALKKMTHACDSCHTVFRPEEEE